MQTNTSSSASKNPWLHFFVILSLLVLVLFALEVGKPTPPVAADAKSSDFSAPRAMPHLFKIAQNPHPIGTPENAEVRAYLIEQLRTLGLVPQVQTTQSIFKARRGFSTGVVNNILVRKIGSKVGGATEAPSSPAPGPCGTES